MRPPEWVRLAQDVNSQNGDFRTNAAATEDSPKYYRESLVDTLLAAMERVLRVRDWRHDEDYSARNDYDLAADECERVLALFKKGETNG